MAYLTIGVGQAGCALLDSLFKYKHMKLIADPIAINSTAKDLHNLQNIKREDWYGISESKGLILGNTAGFEEDVVGGFGKNPVSANNVIESHYQSVLDLLETKFAEGSEKEATKQDIHFAFLFFGLGGGTGCGTAPYIAKALDDFTDNKVNIISVGVLPPTRRNVVQSETDGSDRQAWNAIYGLSRIRNTTDAFILVDNQRIAFESNMESLYNSYNDYVATGISDLISGLLLEQIDPANYPDINPPVIDMQDIMTALSFDHKGKGRETGFAAIGRAAMTTRDMLHYIVPVGGHKSIDTLALAKLAAKKQSLSNIDANDCEKNLALIRAPPVYLEKSDIRINTRGIEEYMVKNSRLNECHLGVALTKRNLVSLTTLYTYQYENIPRIKELQGLAEKYEEKSGDLTSSIRG